MSASPSDPSLPTSHSTENTRGHPKSPTGADTGLSDLSKFSEGETLVLIGCGAAKHDPDNPTDIRAASIGPDESFGPS
jgi:hypothetical protein